MNDELLATITIFIGILPANLFPLLYSRSPWTKSFTGRALMTSSVGLALLFNMGVLKLIFGDDYAGRQALRAAIFLVVVAGSYMQLVALFIARYRHLPEVEPQDAAGDVKNEMR